ncbi:MAG: CRISPR-associated endonuclease Cas2 [Porticoccaceae bacterium]
MSRRQPYLVTYDIADPRRLQRVARCVGRRGLRIQYSVFLAQLTPRQRNKLAGELRRLIDPREDDVRIYPLPVRMEPIVYGRSHWPEGVQLLGGGLPALTLAGGPRSVSRAGLATAQESPTS